MNTNNQQVYTNIHITNQNSTLENNTITFEPMTNMTYSSAFLQSISFSQLIENINSETGNH